MTDGRLYVHYAKSPIDGEWVLPWDALRDELRAGAGHEGKVYEGRLTVYIHDLPPGFPVLSLGTA